MKPKNQMKLFRNGAHLIVRAFLAGSGRERDVWHRSSGNPTGFSGLINLQNGLAEKLNSIYVMYLQPLFFNRMDYQPVLIKY